MLRREGRPAEALRALVEHADVLGEAFVSVVTEDLAAATDGPGGVGGARTAALGAAAPTTVGALAVPTDTGLGAPRPNPGPGRIALALDLAQSADVTAEAYDVLGRRVAVLASGPLGAGTHPLVFDGSALPSGVYVVRAEVRGPGGPEIFVRRVTVAR